MARRVRVAAIIWRRTSVVGLVALTACAEQDRGRSTDPDAALPPADPDAGPGAPDAAASPDAAVAPDVWKSEHTQSRSIGDEIASVTWTWMWTDGADHRGAVPWPSLTLERAVRLVGPSR